MSNFGCRFKYCLHSGELINETEVVRDGNLYYHPDCFSFKADMEEITSIWLKRINEFANLTQLQKVIVDIVRERHVESGMLLYGLKYYISHNLALNYPPGLYYVIQNKDVQDGWKRLKTKKILKETDFKGARGEDNHTVVSHKQDKKPRISDILG